MISAVKSRKRGLREGTHAKSLVRLSPFRNNSFHTRSLRITLFKLLLSSFRAKFVLICYFIVRDRLRHVTTSTLVFKIMGAILVLIIEISGLEFESVFLVICISEYFFIYDCHYLLIL